MSTDTGFERTVRWTAKKEIVDRPAGGEELETRLRANRNAGNGIVSSTTFCLSSIRLIARTYRLAANFGREDKLLREID